MNPPNLYNPFPVRPCLRRIAGAGSLVPPTVPRHGLGTRPPPPAGRATVGGGSGPNWGSCKSQRRLHVRYHFMFA